MTYEEYNEEIKRNPYVEGGSSLHEVMHRASQEAMKITAELNGSYHSAEEVRHLLEKLWDAPLDESFGMFPPFYTDYGKNTKIGKMYSLMLAVNSRIREELRLETEL